MWRLANVDIELDLAADRGVKEREVVDFPTGSSSTSAESSLVDGRIADCGVYLNFMLSHFYRYIELGDGFLSLRRGKAFWINRLGSG